ncbi:MAG: pyrroline-5-carboxylate reductase dimerization domain-containing protein, partial [Pseudomonadota bacterium]
LCEALAQAGVSVGLSKETATELARATIIGASGLLETSDQSAADLRKAVTSPNGTTQAALDVLMASDGLAALMGKAAQAAKTRAEQLSL